ncbi:MAG: PEGA domain-containing protein [Myxococcales bacterium]|nr:MAG: PEGA domain-containing protein [Myxococcales bacterium]
MGIKFIKMDSDSRSVVQRIAEERGRPGVFEQGNDGVRTTPETLSDPGDLAEADRTKVRHVSEFLASALVEGGAGETAKREAQAGAQRARQISNQIGDNRSAAARGAFSAHQGSSAERMQPATGSPVRGAMSAFGGSALSKSARISSVAAPAMDELDADDDFLDDETTKIQELLELHSDFPPDADATVIAKEAASHFTRQQRRTPVVPAVSASRSPFASAVPDLFDPGLADSFGPAPGEFIDASLLDPGVQTVPPPAAFVPNAPGIPHEAFQVPQAPTPVWTMRPTPEKTGPSPWVFVGGFVLLLVVGAGAAWQLGYTDGLMKLAAPYLWQKTEVAEAPSPAVQPAVARTPEPDSVDVKSPSAEEEMAAADAAAPSQPGAKPGVEAKPAPVDAAGAGLVTFQVVSRPSGAFVSVDGKAMGRTPLELEYEVGTQISLFSKVRGYLPRRQEITVGADQEPVRLSFALLPYVIQVVTNPAGARATAVGGGEAITPGSLQFKSMPASRSIVVSKDGYKTVTANVTLADFVEEPRRMAASVNVKLQKDGAAAPAPTDSVSEAAPPPSETKAEPSAGPPPSEVQGPKDVKAEARPEPVEEPKAVDKAPEEAVAPSETAADDAP